MAKRGRWARGTFRKLTAEEVNSYGSTVRRVCKKCGIEKYLFVSPPVWEEDFFTTRCSERAGDLDEKCNGDTITVKNSWRLSIEEGK